MLKNLLKKIYISKYIVPIINILGRPWRGKGAILMYHRVIPDNQIKKELDSGLAVSCSSFENQMKALKETHKICSIDDFIYGLENNSQDFKVVVTFDDGYKDNLNYALPILEKLKIPASIYITTRFLNNNVDMWWYELHYFIQNSSKINFNYNDKNFNFVLKNKKDKAKAYNKLKKLFLNLKIKEQKILIEKITNSKSRENYSSICLNEEEVKKLDKHPLITIGSHGHNHLNLKILSDDEIKKEVNQSLEILKNVLGHEIEHYCYPYGKKEQASEREYNIVKTLSLKSATTGIIKPIQNKNFYSLPRIYVGESTCAKTLINNLTGFYNLSKKFF